MGVKIIINSPQWMMMPLRYLKWTKKTTKPPASPWPRAIDAKQYIVQYNDP